MGYKDEIEFEEDNHEKLWESFLKDNPEFKDKYEDYFNMRFIEYKQQEAEAIWESKNE